MLIFLRNTLRRLESLFTLSCCSPSILWHPHIVLYRCITRFYIWSDSHQSPACPPTVPAPPGRPSNHLMTSEGPVNRLRDNRHVHHPMRCRGAHSSGFTPVSCGWMMLLSPGQILFEYDMEASFLLSQVRYIYIFYCMGLSLTIRILPAVSARMTCHLITLLTQGTFDTYKSL
jgi:hypothetical protein